jgi:hypothetical protein
MARASAMQGRVYSLRERVDEHQSQGCDLTFVLPNLYSARVQQYCRNMSEKVSEIKKK